VPNPEEVGNWKWMSIDAVNVDLNNNPQNYTAWFKIIFDNYLNSIALKQS
jgi:isopentenyl-diphosphate delta-isomerase